MNSFIKLLLGVIVGILSTLWFLHHNIDYSGSLDINKIHKAKIDSLNNILFLEKFKTDSLQKDIDSLEIKLTLQRNDKSVEIKYIKIRDGVISLNADSSVRLLSANLTKIIKGK